MLDFSETAEEEEEEFKIHLLEVRWEHIGPFVVFSVFVVLSGIAKIGFHHAHFLSSRIPESCLLVVVGILWALILEYGEITAFVQFTPELFFHFLLPPIILEAAYSLYNKAFFDNLWTILLYAVVGTAFNFLSIGGLLVAVDRLGFMGEMSPVELEVNGTLMYHMNYTIQPVEVFTFTSIISAVDPVAVLAIFSEVGVNSDLYYMVFGESLLNDGVAVVLYEMMSVFAGITSEGEDITVTACIMGITSFFTIAVGGLLIGMLTGLATALITRFTKEVRVVEPLAVLMMAFLSYMLAELLSWSGIISLIGCGIVQSHYSFKNISEKAHITIHYFISMLSSTMDCIIFLYLGMAVLDLKNTDKSSWFLGFILWTILLCLVVRFISVYFFTYFANRRRMKQINLQEQFIMAYGGLRGGVGFSLVNKINKAVIPSANIFGTTTLMVVMATIWLQGSTIKPLVNLLNVDKAKEEQKSLLEELNDSVIDDLMPGLEIILGRNGKHYFRSLLNDFDENYMMKWFTRSDYASDMTKIFEELALEDHKLNLYGNYEIAKQIGHSNPAFDNDIEAGHLEEKLPEVNCLKRQESISKKPHLLGIPERNRRESTVSNISRMSMTSSASAYTRKEDKKALKHALKDNPFQHMNKPNKNLIHDDDQNLKSQLERRRLTAHMISERLSHQPLTIDVSSHSQQSLHSPKALQSYHSHPPHSGSNSGSNISPTWLETVAQANDMRKASVSSLSSLVLMTQRLQRRRTLSTSEDLRNAKLFKY